MNSELWAGFLLWIVVAIKQLSAPTLRHSSRIRRPILPLFGEQYQKAQHPEAHRNP